MKLSNIASLWWIRVRARWGQELLALVGIAVGVALLFAALVANASLVGSFQRTLDGLVGEAKYQVMARGGATIPESLVREVDAVDGVQAAAPALEVRAEVEGPLGSSSIVLIGFTPAFAELNRAVAIHFSARYLATIRTIGLPAPLAQSLGLVLGQNVVLDVNGTKRTAPLGVQLAEAQVGAMVSSPIGVAPLSYAQRLSSQPGRITRVFVLPRPGRDAEVEAALRRLAGTRMDVRSADFEAALFGRASQPSNQSTAMFSVFSAMVGFLFAFSAVLLTIPARRRVIVDLLMDGYGAAVAVKVMLFDAIVLGTAASATGLLAGDQIARRLFSEPPSFLRLAFPFGTERIVTPSSVVIAALGGIVASCIAVLVPTLLAVRDERSGAGGSADRVRSIGGPRGRRRRVGDPLVAAGLVASTAGVAVAVRAPDSVGMAVAGLGLLAAGMLALVPTLLRLVVAAVDLLTGSLRTVVPYVATTDLRDRSTRVRAIAVTATGAIAVFSSVALQGSRADLQRGLDQASRDHAAYAAVWAVPPGRANLLATSPFTPPRIEKPPQLSAIDFYRGGFLDVADRRVWVIAPPTSSGRPIAPEQVRDGDARTAVQRFRAGGWVLLAKQVAGDLGVGVGDEVVLPTPVPVRLRVAALTTNMGWPPGAVVMNADDYARAWGGGAVSALHASLAPGASAAEGARALRAALGARSGLVVQTAADRERDQKAASREGLVRLGQIAALVLLSAMIAMAAAIGGLIWQRRSFLAAVKLEGYRTAEVWRALVLQAILLVGAGCAAGAAFGLLGQRLLAQALTEVTGFPVIYALAWPNALLTCLAVTAVVVVIVSVFGYRAALVKPESELG